MYYSSLLLPLDIFVLAKQVLDMTVACYCNLSYAVLNYTIAKNADKRSAVSSWKVPISYQLFFIKGTMTIAAILGSSIFGINLLRWDMKIVKNIFYNMLQPKRGAYQLSYKEEISIMENWN